MGIGSDRTVTVKLRLDIDEFRRNARETQREVKGVTDDLDTQAKRGEDSVKRITATAKVSHSTTSVWMKALAAGIGAIPALASPAAGALMAVPAALGVGAAAAVALGVSMNGVGDAMKAVAEGDAAKLDEALNKLAPSAQRFVREWSGLRREWNALGQSTQGAFFDQINGSLTQLTERTLPMLNRQLPVVSAAMGGVVAATAAWAGQSETIQRITDLLDKSVGIIRQAGPALQPWADGFLNLAQTAMPFLSRTIQLVQDLGERWRGFIAAAEASGQLGRLFDGASAGLQQMLDILSKLAGALFQVLASPGTIQAGQILLGLLSAIADVVSGLTGVFTMLPTPIQATVMVISGLAGVAFLAHGALGKLQAVAGTVQGAMTSLKEKGIAAVTGALGGPWGIAIAAATIGIGLLVAEHQKEEQANQQVIASGRELVGIYRDQGVEAGNAAFQRKLGDEAFAKEYNNLRQNGVAADALRQAYSGSAEAQGLILSVLQSKRMANDAEIKAIQDTTTQDINYTGVVAAKTEKLRQNNTELDALIARQRAEFSSTGEVTRAQADYASAAERSAGTLLGLQTQTSIYTSLLDALNSKTASAKETSDALKQAYDALYGAKITQSEATEAYEATVDALTARIEQNRTSTDANRFSLEASTEAGRANRDAIEARLQKSIEMYQADVAAGASVEEATQRHIRRRDELVKEAEKAGFNRGKTQELIDTYGRVPTEVKTDVRLTGAEAVLENLKNLKIAQMALQQGIDISEARKQFRNSTGSGFGGLAHGGRIPGQPSDVDNLLVHGPGGRKFGLATGEFVVNARQTERNLPLLEAINSGVAGYAQGGRVETWPFPVTAAKTKLMTMAEALAKASQMGSGSGAGGWQWQINILRAAFPGLALFSGFRAGDRVASGQMSYHARGRAVDVPPRMDVANWIRSHYGANTKELIHTPMGARQIWNGRDHVFSSDVAAGHYDHVHWAYDQGGWLGPGQTGVNRLGQPEAVLTPAESAGVKAMAGGAPIQVGVRLTLAPQAGLGSALERAVLDLMVRSIRTGKLAVAEAGTN